MGDRENAQPSSKKRVAGREITRDNPGLDDDDFPEEEMGTFKKASEEVLAGRRFVKVRRQQPAASAAAAPNPFANFQLVPPTQSSGASDQKILPLDKGVDILATETGGDMKKNSDEAEKEAEKIEETSPAEAKDSTIEGGGATPDKVSPAKEKDSTVQGKEATSELAEDKSETAEEEIKTHSTAPLSTFQQLSSSQNAFTGLAGSGFSGKEATSELAEDKSETAEEGTKTHSTAPLSTFQQLSSSQNAFTGLAGTGFSGSSFSFGSFPTNGSGFGAVSGSLFGQNSENSSLPAFSFGSSGGEASTNSQAKSGLVLQEVPVETGEENEKAAFTADAILFEYVDGGWKERGKGEVKLNVSTSGTDKARLVMRARGNYRLILNASLYADMKLANMDKKGITFTCANTAGDGKSGVTTFALKFKDSTLVDQFRTEVETHKNTKTAALRTPENSPKASDE